MSHANDDRTRRLDEIDTAGARLPSRVATIAVLPFANMSADPANEHLADGFTQELLDVLARNGALGVTGRTSSFAFKGTEEDPRDIGRRLDVEALLTGSVRKAGERVRITAELVTTRDGFHVWSETFDRALDDLLVIQDLIAGAVAQTLDVPPAGTATPPCHGESHALALRAHATAVDHTGVSLRIATELYEEAIALDATNARALAGLARVLMHRVALDPAGAGAAAYERAQAMARDALAIDDTLADAHEVLGWVLAAFEYRIGEGGAALRTAHALAPSNSRIACSLATCEGILGDLDASLALVRRATEIDPLNPETWVNLGRVHYWRSELEEAARAFDRTLRLSPGITSAHLLLSWVLLRQGRDAQALAAARKEPTPGYRNCGLAIVHHAMGSRISSDRALARLTRLGSDWGFQLACAHAVRGEPDAAFEWLEKAASRRDSGVPLALVHPLLADLRGHPGWPAFIERIGLER